MRKQSRRGDGAATVKRPFTLLELISSLGIFTILMFAMMTFFDAAQRTWMSSAAKTEQYEDARLLMDMISRDLQCAYYENGKVPFWHKTKTSGHNEHNCEALCFISSTEIPHDSNYESPIMEVQYAQEYYSGNDISQAGWVRRAVTSDLDGEKYNWSNPEWTNVVCAVDSPANTNPVFTLNGNSRDDYQKIIPNVVKLNFKTYRKISTDPFLEEIPADNALTPTDFPFVVEIKLTTMAGKDFRKWWEMGGRINHVIDDDGNELDQAETFRKENQKTFTRTVVLGDRGQYY